MRASRLLPGLLAAGALLLAEPEQATSMVEASADPLAYRDGPTRRYRLEGTWLRRSDPRNAGLAAHWQRRVSSSGWRRVSVPDAWNAGDPSASALIGWPVWYRIGFRLPDAKRFTSWRVRFEAVNHRAEVWLNGRLLGAHTGGFEPFELRLRGVRRGRINRLVVRTDNRRLTSDFPPAVFTPDGRPRGGWWNYGGLVREVYLRAVDRIDFASVRVTSRLGCSTCAARVRFEAVLANDSQVSRRVRPKGAIADRRVGFGARTIPPRRSRRFTATARIERPRLWSPREPFLYAVRLDATVRDRSGGFELAARHRLHTGLRSVAVSADGRLLLNGAPVNLRGVAVFDDLPGKGAALTRADHAQTVAQVQDVGATLVRSHYPLHQAFLELADRHGLLVWSEVPVYQVRAAALRSAAIRRAAVERLVANVRARRNHPSVLLWAIANELKGVRFSGVRSYIASAARAARRHDPSRPVGIAIAGHPRVLCEPGYEPVDVIGINDYFGWYDRDVANREDLSPYLDAMRACHPAQALLVTEFGAEANRDGPREEKGTYEFQREFLRYHLGVFATKPWLSGASYWTLREYMIRPGWTGGNPVPLPPGQPLHQKGVIGYDGHAKPAYADLRASYRATAQLSR